MVYTNNNSNFYLITNGSAFGMSAPGALYWLRKLDSATKKAFTYVEANQEKRDA